jgi:uncharacterized protein
MFFVSFFDVHSFIKMLIEHKVRLVEQLFNNLDQEISMFKSHTGLHCIAGCGKCCTKLDVEASPLEFLPWAFNIFLAGKAEEILAELNTSTTSICHIYKPLSLLDSTSGSCGDYNFRGLICRLFGYAAVKNKYGNLKLATCKNMKENQSENYIFTEEAITNGLNVPVFTNYYMQLSQIDFNLGTTILPINKALKRAIEEVLNYYAYRPLPRGFKKIA